MDSETIPLAWADVRQIPMPSEPGDLGESDPGLIPIVIEETQLDLLCDLGRKRKNWFQRRQTGRRVDSADLIGFAFTSHNKLDELGILGA